MAKITDLPAEVLENIFEFMPYKGQLLITANASKASKTDADKTDNIDFGASSSLVLRYRPCKEATCLLIHVKKYLRDHANFFEVDLENLDFGNFIRFIKAMRTKKTLDRFAYNYYSRGSPPAGMLIRHTITSNLESHPTSLKTFLNLMAKIKKEDGIDLEIQHEVVEVQDYQALNNFVAARSHTSNDDHEIYHSSLLRALKHHLENVLDREDEEEQPEDVDIADAEDDAGVDVKVEEMTGLGDRDGGGVQDGTELHTHRFYAPLYGFGDFLLLDAQNEAARVDDYGPPPVRAATSILGLSGMGGLP